MENVTESHDQQSVASRLAATGLDREIASLLSNAAQALQGVHDSTWFVSGRNVIDILLSVPGVASQGTGVISREDVGTFWSQELRERYLDLLRSESGQGSLKQLRLMVYGEAERESLMPSDDIFFALRELHESGSFRTCEVGVLDSSPLLRQARFGITLLREETVAIIPIANGDSSNIVCTTSELRIPVDRPSAAASPALRALVVLDPLVVSEMLKEFDSLWASRSVTDVD